MIAQDVVDVTVRVEQHADTEILRRNKICKFLPLGFRMAARIDDDAFAGFVEQDIGIFLKRIENKGSDL
jgi:hypothetical protein